MTSDKTIASNINKQLSNTNSDRFQKNIAKRRRNEKRFKTIGFSAVLIGILFVAILFFSIISKGYKAFYTHYIDLNIPLTTLVDEPNPSIDTIDTQGIIKTALLERFPEVTSRKEKKQLYGLITNDASYMLADVLAENPDLLKQDIKLSIPVGDDIDMYLKGYFNDESSRTDGNVGNWLKSLEEEGALSQRFNINFFTNGASREPEQAGIRGAIMGSFFTLIVTFVLSFPVGVAAACYLEEFAPKNKWTDIIEVNINNLAAVPSIVFGLLGLAIFINFFGVPRSTALVGGLVLSLMTLPTIIITSRAALKSVPPSIRDAAYGMGASKQQTLFHHTLPLALPGMLTGSIIGMAQALGETAPLLMIGMVAFIVDIPSTPLDPATVLPVQIYLWADSPERAFVEKTSAAIMILLMFLITMNSIAVYFRKKLEKKW